MLIGQTMFGGGTYPSAWFSGQADSAVFSGQLIAKSSSGTLSLIVQTKNIGDADSSASSPANGTISFNAVGTQSGSVVSGLKQLVRFVCTTGTDTSQWTHFRDLPPAWQQN